MKQIALILGAAFVGLLHVSEAVVCKDGDDFLPFPDDCSKYYTCANGQAFEQKCPEGYWFNPANKYCDYPGNIDEKYCPKYDCIPGEIHHLPTTRSCTDYILCYDGTPVSMTCAEGLEFDPVVLNCVLNKDSTCEILNCPAESEEVIFLPNKRDCAKYYICVKGQPVAQECASGLHWSAERNRCEPKASAGCEKEKLAMEQAALVPNPEPQTRSIKCPFFHFAFVPSPTECEYYFACHNGESHIFECPPGTGFDPKTKKCIKKWLVETCLYRD